MHHDCIELFSSAPSMTVWGTGFFFFRGVSQGESVRGGLLPAWGGVQTLKLRSLCEPHPSCRRRRPRRPPCTRSVSLRYQPPPPLPVLLIGNYSSWLLSRVVISWQTRSIFRRAAALAYCARRPCSSVGQSPQGPFSTANQSCLHFD